MFRCKAAERSGIIITQNESSDEEPKVHTLSSTVSSATSAPRPCSSLCLLRESGAWTRCGMAAGLWPVWQLSATIPHHFAL